MDTVEEGFHRVKPKVTDAIGTSGRAARRTAAVLCCADCGYWLHPRRRCVRAVGRCRWRLVPSRPRSVHTFTINRYGGCPALSALHRCLDRAEEQAGMRLLSTVIDCSFERSAVARGGGVFARHEECLFHSSDPLRHDHVRGAVFCPSVASASPIWRRLRRDRSRSPRTRRLRRFETQASRPRTSMGSPLIRGARGRHPNHRRGLQ